MTLWLAWLGSVVSTWALTSAGWDGSLVDGGLAQDRDAALQASESDLTSVIDAASAWLVEHQAATGAWGSHHSSRPIEVFCSPPGSHDAFRVGTTGLCVIALLDAHRLVGRGGPRERMALERGVDYLCGHWDVKRVDNLEHYSVWGLGYGLRALAEYLLYGADPLRESRVRAACAALVEKLSLYQALDGGWGYLSLAGIKTARPSWTSMSFTTATIVVALERARGAGLAVPQGMLDKAGAAIERCRTPSGFFTYGEYWNRAPVALINRAAGAACRTPACLLALALAGRGLGEKASASALENLLVRQARFQVLGLRRPIPHESWYAISGYFYLYGHAYAAGLLEQESPLLRRRFASELARGVLVCRQPDGSFWDYPLYSYHKPYGTAFALIALSRAQRFARK